MKPAAPQVKFTSATGLAEKIVDPVVGTATERAVKFYYDVAGSAECPTANGSVSGSGFLCKIVYPADATAEVTRLYYNAQRQLIRITDPGNEVTDFSYNEAGLLATIRDSGANDWLAANSANNADLFDTEIVYDTAHRAVSVTLPPSSATNLEDRPGKDYDYQPATSTTPAATTENVDGLDLQGAPYARQVTYDSSWRMLTSTSALQLTGTQEWSVKDQLLASTDAWGHKSTVIFNAQDRVTDSYGPAPSTCFDPATRLPLAGCVIDVAHSATTL